VARNIRNFRRNPIKPIQTFFQRKSAFPKEIDPAFSMLIDTPDLALIDLPGGPGQS
jgi:hypothetical protein